MQRFAHPSSQTANVFFRPEAQIITLTSPQDEIALVANEVTSVVSLGFSRKHLLLLHSDGWGVKNLIQAIDYRLGKNAAKVGK